MRLIRSATITALLLVSSPALFFAQLFQFLKMGNNPFLVPMQGNKTNKHETRCMG